MMTRFYIDRKLGPIRRIRKENIRIIIIIRNHWRIR